MAAATPLAPIDPNAALIAAGILGAIILASVVVIGVAGLTLITLIMVNNQTQTVTTNYLRDDNGNLIQSSVVVT